MKKKGLVKNIKQAKPHFRLFCLRTAFFANTATANKKTIHVSGEIRKERIFETIKNIVRKTAKKSRHTIWQDGITKLTEYFHKTHWEWLALPTIFKIQIAVLT
ncbi:MAG: hypothetical protein IPJ79_01525 [Bacteroidetes bacterium]|nr:hypothetical protein [Bacteroidota bacterium]